jgi:serine/threonine protein phosphatase PrpC
MSLVQVTVATHPGLIRQRNEDSVGCSGWAGQGTIAIASHSYSGPDPVVCVVADGLGGQAAGDVASLTVTRELVHNPAPHNTEQLGDALLAAHDLLLRKGSEDPGLSGMATTIAALVVTSETILSANVGDTRIYEVLDGSVAPVSFDDNPAGDPLGRPASIVTQALGGAESMRPRPHLEWLRREPLGFLLCSDGLTNLVADEEIAAVVGGGGGDAQAVDEMVRVVLERGATDNVSAMLVRT